jgi:tRNA (guanine-N7-)-methyltransferase
VRLIRSFVKRQGRLTLGQKQALAATNLRRLTIEQLSLLPKDKPLILDIGFGDGEALLAQALAAPDINFLGVEVHDPGVGHLLMRINQTEAANIWVVSQDVMLVLNQLEQDGIFLDGVQIFFPDPWPKKRHHKRRLVSQSFLNRLIDVLKPQAYVHVATDWAPYAEWSNEAFLASGLYQNSAAETFIDRPQNRPLTKFEAKGLAKGHAIFDLYWRYAGVKPNPTE